MISLNDYIMNETTNEFQFFNDTAKMKIGGRFAPKISEDEFLDQIVKTVKSKKYWDFFIDNSTYDGYDPEDEDEYLNISDYIQIFYDGAMYALGFAPNNDSKTHPFKKAQKDIRKYNVYIENDSEDEDIEVQVTRSGIPYLKFEGRSDYGPTVFWFVYWDGKNWRSYIPLRGNAINPLNKRNFGEDKDKDIEYCKKVGLLSYDIDEDDAISFLEEEFYFTDNDTNKYLSYDAGIEEFENRLK